MNYLLPIVALGLIFLTALGIVAWCYAKTLERAPSIINANAQREAVALAKPLTVATGLSVAQGRTEVTPELCEVMKGEDTPAVPASPEVVDVGQPPKLGINLPAALQ
ncbi:hypothetical protein AB0M43_36510 [Longispora sp. NPDC051575]|uniref:hypothetical protein n=1 Tax=Longispora sp. NPDC051575 TaxID=3154943 RepID=UPI0034266D19